MPEAASGAMGMKIFSEYIAVGCLSVDSMAVKNYNDVHILLLYYKI